MGASLCETVSFVQDNTKRRKSEEAEIVLKDGNGGKGGKNTKLKGGNVGKGGKDGNAGKCD